LIELTEVLKDLKKENKNKELFDILEKLRNSDNTKLKIQATCEYPKTI
jgi:hypothetical protein